MADLLSLQKQGELSDSATDSIVGATKQFAANKAAELFKSGDIKGALSLLAQHDPDHAAQMIHQFQQFDPASRQAIATADETGKQDVLTSTGSNPRQLLDTEIAAGKYQRNSAKEDRLGSQFNQTMAFKYQQSAESSPIYKSAIGVINEMPALKGLLDDAYHKGGQSLAMLGPRIAKGLAGEVGVLTEQDVTRYITNPALARSILSKGEKSFEGKLTKTDYTNLLRLGTIMEKNAQEKLNKSYEQAAKKMSRATGIPLDEAELLVNPTIDEPSKAIVVDHLNESAQKKEAMDWIKANPEDPRVPKIKEKLGIE